jgi:hypothetical protein
MDAEPCGYSATDRTMADVAVVLAAVRTAEGWSAASIAAASAVVLIAGGAAVLWMIRVVNRR